MIPVEVFRSFVQEKLANLPPASPTRAMSAGNFATGMGAVPKVTPVKPPRGPVNDSKSMMGKLSRSISVPASSSMQGLAGPATGASGVSKTASYADRKARRDYYLQNRQRILQKQKVYRAKNQARIARQQKIYRRKVKYGTQRQRRRVAVGNHGYEFMGYHT